MTVNDANTCSPVSCLHVFLRQTILFTAWVPSKAENSQRAKPWEQSGKPVFHGAAKSQTRFDRISLIEQDINWLSAIDYTWPPGLDFRLIELGKETSYSSLRLTSNNEENISKSILEQNIHNEMEFVIYLTRLRWSGLLVIHESAWNLLGSMINRCIAHKGTSRNVGEILLIFHLFIAVAIRRSLRLLDFPL